MQQQQQQQKSSATNEKAKADRPERILGAERSGALIGSGPRAASRLTTRRAAAPIGWGARETRREEERRGDRSEEKLINELPHPASIRPDPLCIAYRRRRLFLLVSCHVVWPRLLFVHVVLAHWLTSIQYFGDTRARKVARAISGAGHATLITAHARAAMQREFTRTFHF